MESGAVGSAGRRGGCEELDKKVSEVGSSGRGVRGTVMGGSGGGKTEELN